MEKGGVVGGCQIRNKHRGMKVSPLVTFSLTPREKDVKQKEAETEGLSYLAKGGHH